MEAACSSSPGSLPEVAEFQRIKNKEGLGAALKWNSERYAEEDAWWKEVRKKT
jgi:hypothetical protein